MKTTRSPVEYALWTARSQETKRPKYGVTVPMLKMFTQSRDEKRIEAAVHDLVVNFVTLCQERGILDKVMHGRGIFKADPKELANMKPEDGGQYIRVVDHQAELYEDCTMTLSGAGKSERFACRH